MIRGLGSRWGLVDDGGVGGTDTLGIRSPTEILHVCRRVLRRLWNATSWNQGLDQILVAIFSLFVSRRLFLIFQRQGQLWHQLRLRRPLILQIISCCLDIINCLVARVFNCLVVASCKEGLSPWQVSIKDLAWGSLIITIWPRDWMSLIDWISGNVPQKLWRRLIEKSWYLLSIFSVSWVHRRALVNFFWVGLDLTLAAACPNVVLTWVDTVGQVMFGLKQVDAACRHALMSKRHIVRLVSQRLVAILKFVWSVFGRSASTLNQLLNSLVVQVRIRLRLQLSQLGWSARRRPVLGITVAWLLPFVPLSNGWGDRLLLSLYFLRCSILWNYITCQSIRGIPRDLLLICRSLTSVSDFFCLSRKKLR